MMRAFLNTCSEFYIEMAGTSPLLKSYGIFLVLKEDHKSYKFE